MLQSLFPGGLALVIGLGVCSAQSTASGQVISPASPPPVRRYSGSVSNGFPYEIVTRLMSAAVKGQPYSLVRTTTTVQTLGDGTKITHVLETHEMRDAQGRERNESGHLKDGKFIVYSVQLRDPIAWTETTLTVRDKTAEVTHIPAPSPAMLEQQAKRDELRRQQASHRAIPSHEKNVDVETLPPQTISGVYAEGRRTTQVFPAGSMDNDRPITTLFENWYSPDLKIALNSVIDDPRNPKITTVITDLQRADPSPQLFEIPADYKVVTRPDPSAAVVAPPHL